MGPEKDRRDDQEELGREMAKLSELRWALWGLGDIRDQIDVGLRADVESSVGHDLTSRTKSPHQLK
jgi:hypothetical protein